MSVSLTHQLYAALLPRVLGAAELVSDEHELERLERRQATMDRNLRTTLTPGFRRRFTVRRHDVAPEFVTWELLPRGVEESAPTLMHVHGGSFVSPIDPAHLRFCAGIAEKARMRLLMPDYPLAPRHTWQDSHGPLVDHLQEWLARPGKFVLSGDSAGGGLALAAALTLRDLQRDDEAVRLPDRMVLLSPWTDLTTSTPETVHAAQRDPWLKLSKLGFYAKLWAGTHDDLGRPEVSPALADLTDLPTSLTIFGTHEILTPGHELLVRRSQAANWDLRVIRGHGLMHDFMFFPGVREARWAAHAVERFISKA